MLSLNGFARRQREGTHGATMEGPKEGNIQFAFCMPASQFEGGFYRFRP